MFSPTILPVQGEEASLAFPLTPQPPFVDVRSARSYTDGKIYCRQRYGAALFRSGQPFSSRKEPMLDLKLLQKDPETVAAAAESAQFQHLDG